ncbi:unnamed protein product, partial [Nesidiocoris tenuis]
MEEADSLLTFLRHRSERRAADNDEVDFPPPLPPSDPAGGVKLPKDEKVVIEELRTVNNQLRDFVQQLLAQLDSSRREVECLRARLR